MVEDKADLSDAQRKSQGKSEDEVMVEPQDTKSIVSCRKCPVSSAVKAWCGFHCCVPFRQSCTGDKSERKRQKAWNGACLFSYFPLPQDKERKELE